MKNKHFRYTIFIVFLLLMAILTGCGNRSQEDLDNELAYRKLGILKMQEGDYEEAVKMFQLALDQSLGVIDELEIDICYYKAAAQYKAGDTGGAFETYTALIEYDGGNADAFYLRGTLYLEQGQAKKAMADYESALSGDKKRIALYNKIAEKLTAAGYVEEAGVILNRGLKAPVGEAEDYRDKGYAYYLLKEYDSARAYLDKAVNMGDKEAIFYLAKLLEAQGETEQADQLYENYVGVNNEDTETLNALGCSKMKEGNYEQALVFFRRALQNESPANEKELRRNEIAALEYLLDFEQAREKMKSYLKDYPQDAEALREYEFLKSR